MSNSPTVSIVLCTYNRADILPRAVRSVQAQSVSDWELIVVDDGSTDNTKEVFQPFVDNDPHIRLLQQNNEKLPAARNTGIFATNGQWITFLDSDDEYKPDHLKKRLEFLKEHPEVKALHGGFEVVSDDPDSWYVVDAKDPSRKIHLNDCTIGATLFIQARLLKELGGFDPTVVYGCDMDLYQRLKKICRIVDVDFSTYRYYRDRGDSMCNLADTTNKGA